MQGTKECLRSGRGVAASPPDPCSAGDGVGVRLVLIPWSQQVALDQTGAGRYILTNVVTGEQKALPSKPFYSVEFDEDNPDIASITWVDEEAGTFGVLDVEEVLQKVVLRDSEGNLY